ncbi:MAG: transcriptional regulator [Burkholderiales bacterium]|nr:MAG: transcriptional regulator [Burkholderiales bacterium]
MEFDVNRIDDVIHGRVRLGIIAFLSTVEAADFTELKTLLETTAGNLSVHLRKLEEAGYVDVTKSILFRKTLTRASITTEGRAAFRAYLAQVRALVDTHTGNAVTTKPVAREAGAVKRRRA